MRARLRGIDDKIIEHNKKIVVFLDQDITLQMDMEARGGDRFTCTCLQDTADL